MPLQRGGVRSHTRSEPAIGNPASPRRHRLSRPCPCRSSLFLFAPPVTPQASLVIPGHAEPVERAVVLLLAPLFGHEKLVSPATKLIFYHFVAGSVEAQERWERTNPELPPSK